MTTSTRPDQETTRFLEYLDLWRQSLRPFSLTNEVSDPAAAAVFSTDMVVGFCVSGNLYSPRIGALIEPVVGLLQRAYAHGVRDFVLLQDTHQEDAPEFEAFPPHCVRGADESQAVREIRNLPFYDQFVTVEKNSLDPASNTTFGPWLDGNPQLRTAIILGDCTDLCVYLLAMHLRTRANARGIEGFRVIVPANAVDTYDLPVAKAREIGAFAHPADFFQDVGLYHLALNGVEVASEVA